MSFFYRYNIQLGLVEYASHIEIDSTAYSLVFGNFVYADEVGFGLCQELNEIYSDLTINVGEKTLNINRTVGGNVWWGTSNPTNTDENWCHVAIINGLLFMFNSAQEVSILAANNHTLTAVGTGNLGNLEQVSGINNFIYGITETEILPGRFLEDDPLAYYYSFPVFNFSGLYQATNAPINSFQLQVHREDLVLWANGPIENNTQIILQSNVEYSNLCFELNDINFMQVKDQNLFINRYHSGSYRLWTGTSSPSNQYENWVYTILIRGLFLLADAQDYTQIVLTDSNNPSANIIFQKFTNDLLNGNAINAESARFIWEWSSCP